MPQLVWFAGRRQCATEASPGVTGEARSVLSERDQEGRSDAPPLIGLRRHSSKRSCAFCVPGRRSTLLTVPYVFALSMNRPIRIRIHIPPLKMIATTMRSSRPDVPATSLTHTATTPFEKT